MGIRDQLLQGFSQRVLVVIAILVMMGMWVWAVGQIPIPGEHGFVFAAELDDKIKGKVGQDIDQLKKQTAETSTKVDNIKIALDQILADYYSKRIKDAVRQRCKIPLTDTAERDRLWDQMAKDVNLYRQYSGDQNYIRPSCQEV